MGIFGKIGEAKFSDGGVYLLPGVYRLKIKSVKQDKARAGFEYVAVEFEVVESTCIERAPGSICSWMVKLSPDYVETALGNIKQFMSSAAGCSMEQVNEQIAEAIVSDKQPLAGRYVRASAVNIKTKRKTDFTKVKFFEDGAGAAAAQEEYKKG
jgi:hypothetical protein